MTDAHRRKKQPDALRAQLLQAAADLAVEQGMAAVTLDAIARRAGVSKGGLQHHFPSKRALLDALFSETLDALRAGIAADAGADPDPHGRDARAYIHATVRESSQGGGRNRFRLLLATMLTEPETRRRWGGVIQAITRPDPLPDERAATLMIGRLAADGLWISDLLGSHAMTPSLRAEVMRQIERMTKLC